MKMLIMIEIGDLYDHQVVVYDLMPFSKSFCFLICIYNDGGIFHSMPCVLADVKLSSTEECDVCLHMVV